MWAITLWQYVRDRDYQTNPQRQQAEALFTIFRKEAHGLYRLAERFLSHGSLDGLEVRPADAISRRIKLQECGQTSIAQRLLARIEDPSPKPYTPYGLRDLAASIDNMIDNEELVLDELKRYRETQKPTKTLDGGTYEKSALKTLLYRAAAQGIADAELAHRLDAANVDPEYTKGGAERDRAKDITRARRWLINITAYRYKERENAKLSKE